MKLDLALGGKLVLRAVGASLGNLRVGVINSPVNVHKIVITCSLWCLNLPKKGATSYLSSSQLHKA